LSHISGVWYMKNSRSDEGNTTDNQGQRWQASEMNPVLTRSDGLRLLGDLGGERNLGAISEHHHESPSAGFSTLVPAVGLALP